MMFFIEKKYQVLGGMWRSYYTCVLLVQLYKICNHNGKECESSSKNKNYYMFQQSHFCIHTQKNKKTNFKEIFAQSYYSSIITITKR